MKLKNRAIPKTRLLLGKAAKSPLFPLNLRLLSQKLKFWESLTIIFVSLAVNILSCSGVEPAQAEFVMGTVCAINLYEGGSRKLYAAVFSRLREIDRIMSARAGVFSEGPGTENSPENDIGRINRNAGREPVKVPEDLITVLEKALYYAERGGGAFDPTIGPLVNLWGIGTETARVPGEDEIQAALALVNWRDVLVNRKEGTVFLRKPGMALDLGAIAKGYAADEAAALIKKSGLRRGIIDLGGNILALGERQGNRPWRIGVQDPDRERGDYLGVLRVQDKSIVTSGVYERYFEAEGRQYHHILSTQNGYPVDNGLLSVTVIADFSIDADGLSTTAFALGYEKGRALIESLPRVEAIFVFTGLSIRGTPGAMEIFTPASDIYRIEE
jgi:thiamine biosynthesis lipoprotein